MAATKKHVVFDAVGTIFSYDSFFNTIDSVLGPRLKAHDIKPLLFGVAWEEMAEREYTYLSISGRYQPFKKLQRALFWRLLAQSGVPAPHDLASEADLDAVIAGYEALTPRPEIPEAIALLRENGWTVWVLTAGDRHRVKSHFDAAGIPFPMENILTCDDAGVGKPDPAAYKPALEKLSGAEEKWFAASHMWDVSAARTVGFKGAYCSNWEKESCFDVFGDMDVMADTPVEMVQKMIKATS